MTLVYVVAGEASGDVLGARLIAAMRARAGGIEVAGIGGARMAEQGVASLFPMQELALMGLAEVLPKLFRLRRRLEQTEADIAARRPDIVVTIDSPGFTLRLLRRIVPLGLRRVHYVAPQVWAWRQGRVKHFPGLWDRLLCLLPFEPDFFAPHGLNPVFVGHPVLESGADAGDPARFRARFGLAESARSLILMPGSRRTETARLMPVFGATVERLRPRFPDLVPVLAAAPALAGELQAQAAAWPRPPLIVTNVAERYDAFAGAEAALTKSGTSTLELALAGVPMAVTYRVNPISAMLARRLIKVPHVAMINLLAGQELVPELLQDACTPERLSAEIASLLGDPERAAAQRAGFSAALSTLAIAGSASPSEAAATAVLDLL
ncbi:lipid-A-disaccharide synthase [Acidiphilium multivorum AIU301]|uniref:Lipid-A-disaccharide synthase n=1 Tax=Acidiphilium multivorum (strain DSM 11245 / JCM 8867 / NBRC 100883 / AIU 301) TaxID=926570 RepID=F0J105_ACIMA|nr:lipid-A-disaccharide synthase [Acidiphilium multivorum]BAJ79387.1 lipid-A-disaccharide synthase [Acidiphilium multivorum AIU301]GAN75176.1 lipid-A-disaccharide synthase [Acidiphilium multivorum AIU301]